MQAARVQQPVGKDMAALRIGAKLDLIDGQKIRADIGGHRFDRADPIGRAVGHDPFLARDQRHDGRATDRDDAIIDLARQQPQRQADHACAVGQHPFNGVVGFAGIRRSENRGDRAVWGHISPSCPARGSLRRAPVGGQPERGSERLAVHLLRQSRDRR